MNSSFSNLEKADIATFGGLIRKTSIERRLFVITNINYVDIYCYFKSRFGRPNGIQSILRSESSDNIYHWDYCLHVDKVYYDFVYSYRQLELNIISEESLNDFDSASVIAEIQSCLAEHNGEIRKEKEEIELWEIFQNTYSRIRSVQEYCYSQYMANYPEDIKQTYPLEFTTEYLDKMFATHRRYISAINVVKNYGLTLRMLYPVAGEALVNLVLYCLAKEEIRNDKRLYDSISRSNIDIRIKTMHLYCNGILSPYSQDDSRFKTFMKLMDKRNDFLHGNVTPGFNTFDRVYFDGTVPIFEEPRDLAKELALQSLFQITKDEIVQDAKTINDLQAYLLGNIHKKKKQEIELIMDARELGWNKKKGKIGILFSSTYVDAFPVAKQ